jgi:flagellar hook assembly protein FlgD
MGAVCPVSLRAAGTDLVTDFGLSRSAFSPDGDGSEDSTEISITLSEDSPSLAIVLYQADSATVVDTLVAPSARAAGAFAISWTGTDAAGQVVPEGLYLVELTAQGTTAADTAIMLPVAVDVTPPVIQILLSEPGIYTPGLAGTPQIYSLTFVISNSSPSYGLPTLEDQLQIALFSPIGAEVTLDTFVNVQPDYDGQDGTYELTWDANLTTQVSDGHYSIDFELTDQAGHRASASDRPNVDNAPPNVGFLNVEDGGYLTAVPDSLHAWAWDRNGIDSLFVRYADTLAYWFIADTQLLRDTTFFSVPLADSVAGEGSHEISIRAKDAAAADTGWVATRSIRIEVDQTAPPPPALQPFDGAWRNPTFEIGGTWSGGTDIVRLYQNGSLIDSVFTVALEAQNKNSFVLQVTLVEGTSVFTATAVDEALNESGPSNEVRVQFLGNSGLFIPAPFGPDDEFHLNLPNAATGATLRIYDLSGDLVAILSNDFSSRNYAFEWDGLNGDGEPVKKGPLLAVSQAEFEAGNGADTIFRELFLFDPDK